MDIFMPIAICVIFLILFTICGWCCKRKREGIVYGHGPNVTVTTQHTAGVVSPPYPVNVAHPIPQTTGSHPPGFVTTAPYPTHMPHPQPGITAYPPTGGSIPYPPPVGGAPYPPVGPTPYPPDVHGSYTGNPPPYDVAVSTPPMQPPVVNEGYGKQAPYNPNFS